MLVSQSQLDTAKERLESLNKDAAMATFNKFLGTTCRVNPKTLIQYFSQIQDFFSWCLGHFITPWMATKDDVAAYVCFLDNDCLTRTGLKISSATKKSRFVTVRRFFKALKENGYRLDDPCFGVVGIKDNTKPVTRMKSLGNGEASLLLDAVERFTPKQKIRNQAAIVLMAWLGLRGFEVCNLQRKDIDVNQQTLLVHGKHSKDRVVKATSQQFEYVQKLLDTIPSNPDAYLFVNVSTKAGKHQNLQPRGLRMIIDNLMLKLNLKRPRTSLHSLRHFCGVELRKHGKDLQEIADLLGHTNINTTRIYTEYVNQVVNPVTSCLDELLPVSKS